MTPETGEKNNEHSATNLLKVRNAILEDNEPALTSPAVRPASHSDLFSGEMKSLKFIYYWSKNKERWLGDFKSGLTRAQLKRKCEKNEDSENIVQSEVYSLSPNVVLRLLLHSTQSN